LPRLGVNTFGVCNSNWTYWHLKFVSAVQYNNHLLFLVSSVFIRPLVVASKGGNSTFSGFPNCPRASVTEFLTNKISTLNSHSRPISMRHSRGLSSQNDGK
jgi:hypothetical protein